MKQDLALRTTHKYVGEYQHLDKWEVIGTVDEIGQRKLELNEDEEEGIENHQKRMIYAIVTPSEEAKPTDEQIGQALHDIYTEWGCACEHDCCGCWSHHATEADRVTGDLWCIEVHSSQNY